MAEEPTITTNITTSLPPNFPKDLPENWVEGQIVSPMGTDIGLNEKYGYNYLMSVVNKIQETLNNLTAANISSLIGYDKNTIDNAISRNGILATIGTLPVANGGTGNTTSNAATATKLETGRTIRTNLASTSTASFDGSANITPGVTGTLPVANGGTGATTAAEAFSDLYLRNIIASSSDFNELIESGYYLVKGNSNNSPITENYWILLHVTTSIVDSIKIIEQNCIIIQSSSSSYNNRYYRSLYSAKSDPSSDWSSWIQIPNGVTTLFDKGKAPNGKISDITEPGIYYTYPAGDYTDYPTDNTANFGVLEVVKSAKYVYQILYEMRTSTHYEEPILSIRAIKTNDGWMSTWRNILSEGRSFFDYLVTDDLFTGLNISRSSEKYLSDMNGASKAGTWITNGGSIANVPEWFMTPVSRISIAVFSPSNMDYSGQIAFDYGSKEFAIRIGENGEWQRIITNKNISEYL